MNGKHTKRSNLTMVIQSGMRKVKQTMCVIQLTSPFFEMSAEILKLNCSNRIRLMNKSGKFQ